MKRRPGITLIEVLVAIFIMAIGLLALLTLFPLGALNMARALRDDRTASAASEAANICDAFNMRQDPTFTALFQTPPGGVTATFQPANPVAPGYPVYVDPFGLDNSYGPVLGVSGTLTPGISRAYPTTTVTATYPWVMPAITPSNATRTERYFTLFDDMGFDQNGLPPLVGAQRTVQRGDQYTWAYMLQCPQSGPSGTPPSPVNLTVVVYYNRPQVAGGENTYAVQQPQADGRQYDTSVTVTWSGAQPQPSVVPGGWILDTTYEQTGQNFGYVHGDFYRVVTVTQTGANTEMLEVQNPFARTVKAVTVLDNVADVFNRGSNQNPSPVPTTN